MINSWNNSVWCKQYRGMAKRKSLQIGVLDMGLLACIGYAKWPLGVIVSVCMVPILEEVSHLLPSVGKIDSRPQ